MLQRLWIAGAKYPKLQKNSSVVNRVFLCFIARSGFAVIRHNSNSPRSPKLLVLIDLKQIQTSDIIRY